MAQKKRGSKYFTARTEIDLDCCKQMSAQTMMQRNRMYFVVLTLALLFMLFMIFAPHITRWPGLFAVLPAAAWFWTTRSAGSKLWMKTVEPTGLEYLVRNITIDRTGIVETKEETGESTKYTFDQVFNIARSKSYLFLFLTSGRILPIEVTYLTGGSPDELESILLRACPKLKGGKKTTGAGLFIACAAITGVTLFGWIGLIALCIIGA